MVMSDAYWVNSTRFDAKQKEPIFQPALLIDRETGFLLAGRASIAAGRNPVSVYRITPLPARL
jgi:hypothetical protein